MRLMGVASVGTSGKKRPSSAAITMGQCCPTSGLFVLVQAFERYPLALPKAFPKYLFSTAPEGCGWSELERGAVSRLRVSDNQRWALSVSSSLAGNANDANEQRG